MVERNIASEELRETSSGVRGTIRKIRQNRFLLEVVTLAGITWLLFLFLVVVTVPQGPEAAKDPVGMTLGMIFFLLIALPILLIASAIVVFLGRLLIAVTRANSCLTFVIVLLFGLIPPLILYLIAWINSGIAGLFYEPVDAEAEVAARLKTADIAGLFIEIRSRILDAKAEVKVEIMEWLKTAEMTRVDEYPPLQKGKARLAEGKDKAALQKFVKGLATAHQQSRNIRAEVIEELWYRINEIYEQHGVASTMDFGHYHELVERYWERNDWFVSTIEAYPHASPVAKEFGKDVPSDVLTEIRSNIAEVQQLHKEIRALVKQLPSSWEEITAEEGVAKVQKLTAP